MTIFTPWRIALVAGVAALMAVIGWRVVESGTPEAEPAAPTAVITTSLVRQSEVGDTVKAYGVVGGSPAASQTLAVARPVIIERLLVVPGQSVAAGAALAVLRATPAGDQSYRQATDAAAFAEKDLARVQRLFDDHLAANDQLLADRKTLADAKSVLGAQNTAGHGVQTLTAPFAGVVSAAPIAAGDHVAADAPLMTVIRGGGLMAQLGVEPGQAARLAPGQTVELHVLGAVDGHLQSRLAAVGHQVDATTRLVFATAPLNGAGFALGSTIEATITVARRIGLTVPRKSLIYDEAGVHVFVVQNGKVQPVPVTPGAEVGDSVAVTGALQAGATVAVDGAYELEAGMAVRSLTK